MVYETLIVERHDVVTLVRINRPQQLNALNATVRDEIFGVAAAFDADTSQRCMIVTGNEKAFVAGADIKEMDGQGFADAYDLDVNWQPFTQVRKPIIAAVAGYALGGGCELAMMCDIVIAADNARFGQPEIKLGIAPGMGGSQRLARAVGKTKAMEMCLAGTMMDAAEAQRAGLVSRVVPVSDLIDEAMKTAQAIGRMPPLAAIANKEMVNAAFEMPLAQGLLFERRLCNGLFATADKDEGMNAFVAKRPANWTGR